MQGVPDQPRSNLIPRFMRQGFAGASGRPFEGPSPDPARREKPVNVGTLPGFAAVWPTGFGQVDLTKWIWQTGFGGFGKRIQQATVVIT